MTVLSALRALRLPLAAASALALAGCLGSPGTGPVPGPQATTPQAAPSQTIGSGSVRVALILPLTGQGGGAVAAASLRNAAELAIAEFQNPDLTIIVKDDKGTPEGAREAAQQALAEGAELIIGPLFAGSVQAAAAVARGAGRPIIAFSTDATVASRGVYLLSFLPQPEVDRVIDYAAAQNRRSYVALIPDTTYGSVVEAQFRESVARKGARVVAIERYAPGQGAAAVARVSSLVTGSAPQADAIFIPDGGDSLAAVGQALTQAGFSPQRVRPIGTSLWGNDGRALRSPALQGGWYAAPETAGYSAFAGRYRAKYGSEPTRIATLSYDAVSLAAALVRTQGSQRFSDEVIANPSGFAGADGVFRFKPDGTNDRGLAVLEIRNGSTASVSPSPRALGSGT